MEEEEGEEEKEARKTEMEEKDEEQRFFIDNADHYQKRLNERRKVLKKWWDEEFSCFGGEFPNKRRRRQPTSAELRPFFEEMLGPDRSALLAERQKKTSGYIAMAYLESRENYGKQSKICSCGGQTYNQINLHAK